ncbi:MAG TPA: extracellular solute-binding protein, partial [Thermoanaerobaculia bacterium]
MGDDEEEPLHRPGPEARGLHRRLDRGGVPLRRLAVLTLAFALAGCDRRDEGTVTLEFWGMGREGEVVAELIPEFERRNPGIRVQVQQMPWTAAHEKILTAIVGEATPDLGQIGNSWVPEFVAIHALERLDPWVARSRIISPKSFFAGIWDTNVIDGGAYGIPWYVDTRVLFYRTDILAAAGVPGPPRTWAEWRDTMEKVEAHVGKKGF